MVNHGNHGIAVICCDDINVLRCLNGDILYLDHLSARNHSYNLVHCRDS
jgi:hypothetical protein